MASENLPPQIISRLMCEIRDLVRKPLVGIEYYDRDTDSGCSTEPSSSVTEIHASIRGPEETPFSGGNFLMKLVFSEDYPNSPPRGYFIVSFTQSFVLHYTT